MATPDPYIAFKNVQKESWGLFSPLEVFTTIPAAALVKFSHLTARNTVLDVGCGTGVVAITAAKMGAKVSALDLSPALLERAKVNTALAKVNVDWHEGDVEALPFADHSFDVVLSQFGHMFAPRPQVATQEILRVLKPGGTIAFSTWPPSLFVGSLFDLVRKYSPPPVGVPSPSLWGDPNYVREQLKNRAVELTFDQGVMCIPALSLGHYQHSLEASLGPISKLVKDSHQDATQLNLFRVELEKLATQYYEANHIHQHFLMTRAKKML